jgi:release factor glutamine methyltransferase
LNAATDGLRAAGVEDPRLDAEVLLAKTEVPPPAARLFGEMVRRRLRREPVAYIVGRKGFRRLELAVDRRVLIPRPETELLVEVALERAPATLLDVGTGSGAIALAVADEMRGCSVTATDTSPGALEVARGNAERLGLAGRIRFLDGTIPAGQTFDLVVANLPYVAERDWPSLQPEVTQWEPGEALLSGPDGLDAIRLLLAGRGRLFFRYAVETTTAVALEVGEGQAGAVAELLREAGFSSIETRSDLAGIDRVVLGER